MSEVLSNPTLLLHKYLKVSFEDVEEIVLVTAYNIKNDALEVKVNPGSESEAYAEMYLEDNPTSWYIIEIIQ